MKTARSQKVLAGLLAVLFVLLAIPAFTLPAYADGRPIWMQQVPTTVTLGETIYQPTLTGSGNGVPEGWVAAPTSALHYSHGAAAGAWVNSSATTNSAIKAEGHFTYGTNGLSVTTGSGDFAVVFPGLTNIGGEEVENYVYSLKISNMVAPNSYSIGFLTDVDASATTSGSSAFLFYAAGGTENLGRMRRKNPDANAYVARTTADAMTDGIVDAKVVHYNDTNYVYFKDSTGEYRLIHTQSASAAYGDAVLNGVGLYIYNAKGAVIENIQVEELILPATTEPEPEPETPPVSAYDTVLPNDYYFLKSITGNSADTAASWTENFASTANGALPANWDKESSKNFGFLWAPSGSGALGFISSLGVQNGTLKLPAYSGGSHILLMPDMKTSSYALEITVRAFSGGSIGIATDLTADPANSKQATIPLIYPGATGTDPSVRFRHNSGTVIRDYTAEETGTIEAGKLHTLTVVNHEGKTKMWIDGEYIGEMANANPTGTRAGIYTCGGSYDITEIKAAAISPKTTTIQNEVNTGKELYSMKLDGTNTPDVSDWNKVSGGFQWNANYGSFTPSAAGVKVTSSGGTQIVSLPALGTTNYVISATMTMDAVTGSFGFVNGLDSTTTSTSAMHSIIYPGGGSKLYHYNRNGSSHLNARYYDTSLSWGTEYKTAGQTVTMTLYQYEGVAYLFVDNKFISAQPVYKNTDIVGFYSCGATFTVTEVTVKSLIASGTTDAVDTFGASIRYADANGNTTGPESSGLRFHTTLDKTSELYKLYFGNGDFLYDVANEMQIGVLLIPTELLGGNPLTLETENVLNVVMEKVYAQDENTVTFVTALLGIPENKLETSFTARAYVKLKTDGDDVVVYEQESIDRTPVTIADNAYQDMDNAEVRARLDAIFGNCPNYQGANATSVSFTVLADFHYKQDMYMSTIADLTTILDRADAYGSDFIVHMGDFSNDYLGSPELTNAYLNNKYGLPAFGVYGNHELESENNSMQVVTPLLNSEEVIWGTADGKIGDGSIGYYYVDLPNGYRLIGTDTNYSWNPKTEEWEHNYTCSYGYPEGNTQGNSLGPVQLAWLEEVLADAAAEGKHCIITGHESFSGVWSASPDTAAVQEMIREVNATKPGTVMMVLNGHLHTDHIQIIDNVLYMDVNTVRNGRWLGGQTTHHYTEETFKYEDYDANGNLLGIYDKNLNSLGQAMNTWFFQDAMSANVTIYSTGRIVVEGMTTDWYDGLEPTSLADGKQPSITGGTFYVPVY